MTPPAPPPSTAAYYTTLEVARMLGMAVRSIQLMVDRGDLQAWKTPGGHRRITRESLERWMRGSVASSPAQGDGRRSTRRRGAARAPRVLVIEDSTHYQNLLSMLFEKRFPDVELHVAVDGILGLASFGHLQPDLLIVDILLPGIDGATLIAGLRRHALFGRCELIVLTALDEAQRAPYQMALEGVPVVHKSRLVGELPGLVEQALAAVRGPEPAALS